MSPFLEVATLSATPAPAANGEAPVTAPAIDPALAAKLEAARQHIHTGFAQVVMTLMRLPRYKNCTLADLEHLVLDPLLRNRIAIAHAKPRDAEASQADALAGIAIWAKVSPEVDAKIREQIKAKVFPLRLKSEDWASGDITWLLDVIAPNPKLATSVLANFRQLVAAGGELFAHPMIRGLIDSEVLNKAADAPKAAAAAQSADKGVSDVAGANQTLN